MKKYVKLSVVFNCFLAESHRLGSTKNAIRFSRFLEACVANDPKFSTCATTGVGGGSCRAPVCSAIVAFLKSKGTFVL